MNKRILLFLAISALSGSLYAMQEDQLNGAATYQDDMDDRLSESSRLEAGVGQQQDVGNLNDLNDFADTDTDNDMPALENGDGTQEENIVIAAELTAAENRTLDQLAATIRKFLEQRNITSARHAPSTMAEVKEGAKNLAMLAYYTTENRLAALGKTTRNNIKPILFLGLPALAIAFAAKSNMK